MLAPNARLRAAVTASAGPAGSTLQVLEQARERMALPVPANVPDRPADEPRSAPVAGRVPLLGSAAGAHL